MHNHALCEWLAPETFHSGVTMKGKDISINVFGPEKCVQSESTQDNMHIRCFLCPCLLFKT